MNKSPDSPPLIEARIKLNFVFHDAFELYKKREKDYGNSWTRCEVSFLLKRLLGEIDEANYLIQAEAQDWDYTRLHDELLDVINVAAMLAARLDKK